MQTALRPEPAAASIERTLPSVSVVIPCHAPDAVVLALVERAWGQEPGLAELVLVDDASPEPVAQPAGGRVVRLGENRGAGAARNAGARASTSDVVVFADSDVEPLPGAVQRVRELLAGPCRDAVGLVGVPEMHPGDGAALTTYKMIYLDRLWRLPGREVGSANGSLVAVRRTALEAAGGFPEEPGAGIEDVELGGRLAAAGGRLVLCRELRYRHHKAYRWGPTLGTTYRRALDFARRVLIRSRINSMGRPAQAAANLRTFWRFFAFYAASLAAFYVPLAAGVHAVVAGRPDPAAGVVVAGALGLWALSRLPLAVDLAVRGGARVLVAGILFQVGETVLSSIAMLHAALTPGRGAR